MKAILSLLLIFLFTGVGYAQTPPILICTELNGGDITLTWDGSGCTTVDVYKSSVPAGSPQGIFSIAPGGSNVTGGSFVDAGANPVGKDIYYYITCTGQTFPTSDTLIVLNGTFLEPPVIRYVTVQPDNSVLIVWNASTSSQAYYYQVLEYDKTGTTGNIEIDTTSNLFFTDYSNDPELNPIPYTVETFDRCDNNDNETPNYHQTMFLSGIFDNCANEVNLSWTRYIGWNSNVVYQPYVINGGITSAVTPASADTSAAYTQFQDGDVLTFFVKAINTLTGDTSESNRFTVTISVTASTDRPQITRISIPLFSNDVEIQWSVPAATSLASFVAYRKPSFSDEFERAWQTNVTTYNDQDLWVDRYFYTYRVDGLDACNNPSASNEGNTILLEGKTEIDFINKVSWNSYDLGGATNIRYILYRQIDLAATPIATFTTPMTDYADDVRNFYSESGIFNYYVRVEYDMIVNGVNTSFFAYSNTIELIQSIKLSDPNAFAPDGVNKIFKPNVVFGDEEDYEFVIYNRWGDKVFETNDVNEGWNGQVNNNGKDCPLGVYTYYIKYKSNAPGTSLSKRRGIVTLIR